MANSITIPATGLSTTDSLGRKRSTTSSTTTIDNTLLGNSVSSILGLKETAATDTANAAAQKASVTGYQAEQTAYGQVEAISGNNAAIAKAAGEVTRYQDLYKALATIGTQQQGVAASGLRRSGSNLALLRSSLQQTYLGQQADETQTGLNVGGYLAEGLAAKAEGAAAGAAADSATALGTAYTNAASLATTNAANETTALNDYLGKNTILTPAEKLLLAPLSSDITAATSITNTGTVAGTTVGSSLTPKSTPKTNTTTDSGYDPNSTITIGGVNYKTDASGRVIIQANF